MAIIWGGGSKVKNPGDHWVPFYCNRCERLGAFHIMERYSYGHLYGIRLAKFKAKYFLVCATCDRVLPIDSKAAFQHAQMISRRFAEEPEYQPNVLPYMVDVARYVLNDPQLAKALESGPTSL